MRIKSIVLIILLLSIYIYAGESITPGTFLVTGKTVSVDVAFSLPEGKTGKIILWGEKYAMHQYHSAELKSIPVAGSGTITITSSRCIMEPDSWGKMYKVCYKKFKVTMQ